MKNNIRPLQAISPVVLPARRRRQGSLLVLVVVCLVLMALLGAAYLQVARVDRFATADNAQSNIDQVANATIAYIAKVLQKDIVDDDGGFFAQASANPYADNTGNEGYDYPWTNANSPYAGAWRVTVDPNSNVPSTGNADGGIYDDTWLSSTFPTFDASAAARWDHITNLMGTFLMLPSSTGDQQPTEMATRVADGAYAWRNDSAVPIANSGVFSDGDYALADPVSAAFQALGIDTDLDGIPDAKWQWAPLRQIGSVKYVMAVRIIDNASLINLNTATALSGDGDSVLDARGYLPSEIDLSRLLKRVNPSANWQNELVYNATTPNESLFNRRGVHNSTLPTPLGSITLGADGRIDWSSIATTSRMGSWYHNAQRWGDPTNKLGRANEIELRRYNGVNNVNVNAAVEDALAVLLRRNNTETGYNDPSIYSSLTSPPTSDLQRRLAFFEGSSASNRSDIDTPIAGRDYPSLRNQLTTYSAAAIFASNAGQVHQRSATTATTTIAATPPPRTLKYDLVNGNGGNTNDNTPRVLAIRERLFKIFRISNTAAGNPNAYLNFDNSGTGAAALADIATEFALAIHAYSNPTSTPSRLGPPDVTTQNGRTYYSLETLPFFREVYVQVAYQNRDLLDAAGVAATPGNGLPDTLVYVPDSAAVAFEIGNPFDRPINFDDPNGPNIRVVVGSNIYPISGTLGGREHHIFHASRTNTRPEGNDTTSRGNLVTDLGLGTLTNVTALTPADPDIPADNQITFELQVEVPRGSNNWVTYDRMTDDDFFFEAAKLPHYPAESAAIHLDKFHHEIRSVVRPCSEEDGSNPDIYYISNVGRKIHQIAAVPGNDTFPATPAHFGNDQKEAYAPDSTLAGFQIPIANRQFVSVAELGWIITFGFYTSTDPGDNENGDFPARMESTAANPSSRFLQFDVNPVPNHPTMQMSHGALVLEQFTTLSPANDGVDNDGDGVNDNDAEQVVYGQININTAPLHLLTLAAPLNENIDTIEDLMRSIIAYRDDPAVRANFSEAGAATRPDLKGIASIGELLNINNATNLSDAPRRINGYSAPLASSVDLYPMPEEGITPPTSMPLQATSHPEVQLSRFQFLSQAFNTRSDVYTAFVRLRGYPAQDFSKGEVESLNFLVVFDRSNIVNPDDMPKILGVYFYNVP